jgi:hypothetical protein
VKANLATLDELRDELLDMVRNSGASVTLDALARALDQYRRELRAEGEHDGARAVCAAAGALHEQSERLAEEEL